MTTARVHRIQLNLTPRQAVLAAIAEAHEYRSLSTWHEAITSWSSYEQPLVLLVERVKRSVHEAFKQQPPTDPAPAPRRPSRAVPVHPEEEDVSTAAIQEAMFLYELHAVVNEFVDGMLARTTEPLRLLAADGRALATRNLEWIAAVRGGLLNELEHRPPAQVDARVFAASVKEELTRVPRWLGRASALRAELEDVAAAVSAIAMEHFGEVELLFEEERSRLDGQIELLEMVSRIVVESESLVGVAVPRVERPGSITPQLVRGFVIAAQMTALSAIGQTGAARRRAAEFLDSLDC